MCPIDCTRWQLFHVHVVVYIVYIVTLYIGVTTATSTAANPWSSMRRVARRDTIQILSHWKTAGGSPLASSFVLHDGGTAPERHHEQSEAASHLAFVLTASQPSAFTSTMPGVTAARGTMASVTNVGRHPCSSAQSPTSSMV